MRFLKIKYECALLSCMLFAVSMLTSLSSIQTVSAITQCRFDPSGYFYLKADQAAQFPELAHIALRKSQPDNDTAQSPGLYTTTGEVYPFNALTADWSNNKKQFVFEFTTGTVNDLSYAFSGRFLQPCEYEKEITNPTEVVAQGLLTRLKSGKKVTESTVELTYSPRIIENKNTALLLAARDADIGAVRAALSRGADVNGVDFNGMKVLEYAVQSGNEEVVKTLIAAGADVNEQAYRPAGPLKLAAAKGYRIVEILLSAGANPNPPEGDVTPLMNAAHVNSLSIVTRLLEARANVNAKTRDGFTALMAASSAADVDPALIKALITAGADVNAKAENGTTALIEAARYGNEATCKTLIDAKADVKVRTVDNRTALAHAVLNGRLETVKALLAAGAEAETQGFRSFTILREAITQPFPENLKAEIVRALVSAGANVNSKNKWGAPILLEAVQYASPEVLQILLSARADANAKDQDGRTALIEAVSRGASVPQTESAKVKLLIAAGADVNARDNRGSTPLGIATSNNAVEIINLLRTAGAKN
jgi:serine/threonine-protein phosphatase 6 regulatory ankyrin repeat subunit B